jgi:saccharopine dehydrogenase (NAD+, L-lysine-forming)
MRVVVVGACGAVGREVSRGLAAAGAFDRIVLADLDGTALRALAPALDGPVRAQRVDASDPRALRAVIRGAQIFVNCTSYRLGVPALRAAIAERVSYLDLGGLYNTPRQLELADRARRAGVTAVIGCGATPGLTNVLVRRAADRLDDTRDVHISFASHRDLAPSAGLLDTLLDEFRPGIPRYTWVDGRMREVAPFEGARRVRFAEPVGVQEVYYVPHSETYTLPRTIGNGLRTVAVRGTWRPADMRILEALSRFGLTRDRPVRVGRVSVRPIDVLRTLLLQAPPVEPGAACAFFLHVEVAGRWRGKDTVIRARATHPVSWGPAATGRMTAAATVAGALLLARGIDRPGVRAPEEAFDPEEFLRLVGRAGVRITTSVRPA